MAYAMSDAIAEEAYARHMKIMAAVLSALAGGASTAGGAAGKRDTPPRRSAAGGDPGAAAPMISQYCTTPSSE